VREVDGERHHLRRGAVEMEIVPNSCANKKEITQENMKEEDDVPLGWHHGK
jgi:hypothetical protein